MRILGIDPGYGRMGYGVVDRQGSRLLVVALGVIETPPGELPARLGQIKSKLDEVCDLYKPDCLATEKLFFTKNQTTGIFVGAALGCVLLVAYEQNLPWSEYSPPQVKQRVTGNGAATKAQVQFMITRLLSLTEAPKPDDVADALAVAVAHALGITGA